MATFANEIQTPLRTIQASTDLLRKNDIHREDEESKFVLERHGLEQIAKSVEQMMEIMQRLQSL